MVLDVVEIFAEIERRFVVEPPVISGGAARGGVLEEIKLQLLTLYLSGREDYASVRI